MSGQDVFMTNIWISDDFIFCQDYNNADVWYRSSSLKSSGNITWINDYNPWNGKTYFLLCISLYQ